MIGKRTVRTSGPIYLALGIVAVTAATAAERHEFVDAGQAAAVTAEATGAGKYSAGKVVALAPGADGLAAAIAQAGRNGTVIMLAGLHTESASVTIDVPVSILGEPGSILESTTAAGPEYPLVVDPALHVRARGTRIQGLELRPPAGTTGGCAVLIEGADSVSVTGNTIQDHQFGVLVQGGDQADISGNTIAVASGWTTGELPEAHGIVIINGRSARVEGNTVSGALFAIWACDRHGSARWNMVTGSFVGLVLCKVPQGNFLISGSDRGADSSAENWVARDNVATGNEWGYLVIDGANRNTLLNNAASGNATYDMELTGDTYRFGFLTPKSYRNLVIEPNLTLKDCGDNNRVLRGTLIDTTADPCF